MSKLCKKCHGQLKSDYTNVICVDCLGRNVGYFVASKEKKKESKDHQDKKKKQEETEEENYASPTIPVNPQQKFDSEACIKASLRYKELNEGLMILSTFLGGFSASIIIEKIAVDLDHDNFMLFAYSLLVMASFSFLLGLINCLRSNIYLNRYLDGATSGESNHYINYYFAGLKFKNLSQTFCIAGSGGFAVFLCYYIYCLSPMVTIISLLMLSCVRGFEFIRGRIN